MITKISSVDANIIHLPGCENQRVVSFADQIDHALRSKNQRDEGKRLQLGDGQKQKIVNRR